MTLIAFVWIACPLPADVRAWTGYSTWSVGRAGRPAAERACRQLRHELIAARTRHAPSRDQAGVE